MRQSISELAADKALRGLPEHSKSVYIVHPCHTFPVSRRAMYKILIVDEEEHLLWALEKNLFPERDDISVITANSGEKGLEILQTEGVHLLVSDIKMPGRVDGFQLILRAKEIAPESRVIIMTAFGTARIQNFADRIGITHYIEKPFNVSELRDAILELLDEKQGFQGVLSDLELTDIIQMLCLSKRTALLHLKYREHRGKIVFDKGDILHSEFDDVVGDEAVFRMLALKQGDIFMQSDFQVDHRTVTMSWQDLLFEGVKRADESRLTADDEPDDNTDVGMGIAVSEVDKIVEDADDLSQETSFPFFSDEELAEIETAGTPTSFAPAAEPLFSPVNDALESDNAFGSITQTPFQGTPSIGHDELSVSQSGAMSRLSSPLHQRPTVFAETDDPEIEFRTPFREHAHSAVKRPAVVTPDVISPDAFQTSLEDFARDCPGLIVTGIVSLHEGIAMNSVAARQSHWDVDAIAAFFADVVAAAERTVRVLSLGDSFQELQIALEKQFVLFRCVEGTSYVHVAVVEKATSLGVALVLMRRFQKNLRRNLGT